MTEVNTTVYEHLAGQNDGVVIGPSGTGKLYFYGSSGDTPVVQVTSASFTTTLAATTTTTATTTALQADIDAIRTRLNKLMEALNEDNYNLIATS